jgi:hypothetical protein
MSFKRLDPQDISISAEAIAAPLWSTGVANLQSFFTSSNQVAGPTGDFYYKVYSDDQSQNSEFSITFGDKFGRGTPQYNSQVIYKSPSATIFGQYRNLVFGDEDAGFVFGTAARDTFYVITFDRSRYKERLLPGSFNITLANPAGTGATIKLTDNSKDVTTVSYVDAGRVYEIVSGSNGTAYTGLTPTGFTTANGSYGKFLPDVGVVILNASALNLSSPQGIDLGVTISTNTQDNNMDKLYSAIKLGASCDALSEETISSNYIFVRVRNSEYNYSTNPSNITGSGELTHTVMVNTPQAYITTVGLYNDSNDLLAVAKLSKPLLKDFTKEALVRIKLDY